jgi:HlyD family secretion protein
MTLPLPMPAWQASLDIETTAPSLRRLVRTSIVVVALGFGGFLTWASLAPLDSAVPATGTIVVDGKRKSISLLDSGILKELLVHEGEKVAAGQVLFRLDEVQAKVQVGQLTAQYWGAVSKTARLRAEQADSRALTFPADLENAARADVAVAALIDNERRLFTNRWLTYDNTVGVQRKRILQLNEQIAAARAQIASSRIRLRNVDKQLAGARELLPKGYVTRDKVMLLEGQQAELTGNMGEYASHEGEARENIAQAQLEISRIEGSWRADVARDLQDAQAQITDVSERLKGADDLLQHKDMTAPEAGTVTDIKFFTPGSSIVAGQPVLDIVPADSHMLVEVPVTPNDIEHVHPGQRVNVRLTSYKQHKVPVLTGTLVYVSADRQTDPRGEPFFLARAELDPGALAGLTGVVLYPGMPAETLIIGGERVALDYFLSPITDSMRRAFREE